MHSTLPRDPCINFSTAGLSNGRHFSNIIYILVPVPLSYPGVPLDSTIARSGPRSRFKCAGQEWQCYYGVVKVTTQGSRATAGRCTAPCGRGPEATTATATAATIAVAAMRAVAECRHRRSALPAPPPSPPRRATASERRRGLVRRGLPAAARWRVAERVVADALRRAAAARSVCGP